MEKTRIGRKGGSWYTRVEAVSEWTGSFEIWILKCLVVGYGNRVC